MNIYKLKVVFLLLIPVMLLFFTSINAQDKKIRKSPKAKITQTIGVDTEITFDYSRPGVKERTIWGELIPFGLFEGNKYSDNKPFPWRIGANENTTIEVSSDVTINGELLPAGKYGMHAIPGENEWIIMFSKDNDLWGSYKYNKANDALRITVEPVEGPHQEWLTFGFEDLKDESTTAFFHWEKLKIPFTIQINK